MQTQFWTGMKNKTITLYSIFFSW